MKTLLCLATAITTPFCAAGSAVTIYNQNFAVVRDQVPLTLKQGVNDASYIGATLQLEPDSVILRDRSGKTRLQILEQSYRGDAVSQGLLLDLCEGRTIDFLKRNPEGETLIKGRIVRSGYTPPVQPHGQRPQPQVSPIIEVDGQLRFSLPGEPLFPSLGEGTILEPMLGWKLHSSQAATIDAELSYITGGMGWQAAYNFVFPEKGDTMDVVGWVTLDNRSGKRFDSTEVKLIAGDVSKLREDAPELRARGGYAMALADGMSPPQVTEKAFDEFHLYTLPGQYTLRDQETKQVEFMRATGVKAETVYVYNGAAGLEHYHGWDEERIRNQREFGTASNKKVHVLREFMNTKENGLGLPLPAGRTRFYRQDDADGRPEFTGENRIDHTPSEEKVSIYTGDSFDLVGERRSTDYKIDTGRRELSESFEITLRNRKKQAVEIRVAERLYRGATWSIVEKSDAFTQVDARNIEFRIPLKPDEERKVTYRVQYTW